MDGHAEFDESPAARNQATVPLDLSVLSVLFISSGDDVQPLATIPCFEAFTTVWLSSAPCEIYSFLLLERTVPVPTLDGPNMFSVRVRFYERSLSLVGASCFQNIT